MQMRRLMDEHISYSELKFLSLRNVRAMYTSLNLVSDFFKSNPGHKTSQGKY